jgi:photosynthetic reaction center cytochrome c subunit
MRSVSAMAAAAALLACVPQIVRAQAADQKTTDQKTAEQVYKNITALKGIPADELLPTMQFMAASLGVQCTFCHVQGKMDSDDKGPKRTARQMIAMTIAINKDSFRGRVQVSCYSCHRGAEQPVGIPPVQETDTPSPAEARNAPTNPTPAGVAPLSVDEIVQKYVTALGGEAAMRKITSRSMTGKITAMGSESPIEVLTKAPNKRITISHMGGGESYTAFDGTSGWMGNSGRPAREMSPAESAASSIDAEFYLALRLKEMFPQLRRGRPEKIGDTVCQSLFGSAPGKPQVRFYFDNDSGLLVREVRYAETPVGRMPAEIDYADYREVDGVKMPFRWTLSRPNGRFTIQIAEVKANAPIDDSKFAKPQQ